MLAWSLPLIESYKILKEIYEIYDKTFKEKLELFVSGLRPPKDYSDTFRVLFENGFLEKAFFESLVNMVKFRDRLVHIYWEIDNEFLYSILKNNVKDLKGLINRIIEILEL
ncbi:MAG: type VII toxin-antitoxin system HepT family RNase toxin [Dictyoglomus sp.]